MLKHQTQVWSCGGGTQSCAIAALIVQGRLPKPDVAVICDTEYEKQSTWTYYETILKPQLATVGVDLVRIKRSEWANPWANRVVTAKGLALIPAFGLSETSGEVIKLSAYCSNGWKMEARRRWLSKTHKLKPAQIRTWLGFSLDEPKRWLKLEGKPEIRLPLIHDVPLRREQSIRLVVEEMGWPEPPRSNCWMCPHQRDDEWMLLQATNPSEFQQAIEFEQKLHTTNPDLFLHRSLKPLDQVVFQPRKGDTGRACDSGHCFV